MGRIIRLGSDEGPTHPFLTKTGQGGVLSPGYLRDRPADEYVEDDETPVFLLTNSDRGVTVEDDDCRDVVTPGPGYRTIAVVTDRRVVVVVGDSSEYTTDGDQAFTIPLSEVESATTAGTLRDARLEVVRSDGTSLTLHCGDDGLEDVEEYVEVAAEAWREVEDALEGVERTLTEATDHYEAGDHEVTLETARDAYDLITDARETAARMNENWPGSALAERIRSVEGRCVRTVANIRLGRARSLTEQGEANWRDDAYEAAHDAFDRARAEYETLLSLDDEYVPDVEAVRGEASRLDRLTSKLRESPLRDAVQADKEAREADDPATAAAAWSSALAAYRTAMDLDWGADERRFAGDPDEIQARLDTVVERLLAARRTAAKEAREAGDWHVSADRVDAAIEDFDAARQHYEHALAVARDCYPAATDHLTVELEALEDRIERVSVAREAETATEDDHGRGDRSRHASAERRGEISIDRDGRRIGTGDTVGTGD